jgi:hypothetical protein
MPTASVPGEMIKALAMLNKDEQKSILQMIKVFLQSRLAAKKPQTIEEYNKEIKGTLRRAKRGETTSVEKLEEEMKVW